MTIKKQKPKTTWVDEAGHSIPWTHIKQVEKVNEAFTFFIAQKALKVSAQLKQFKADVIGSVDTMVAAFHDQYEGKKKVFKGNYTLFNFDRSIKIEVHVGTPIKFDDMLIQKAKSVLDDFLKEGISAKHSFIKEMVLSAFETSRGQMDVKKIMALKKYSDRITDKRYTEAMRLIDSAIRKPKSETYYQVWIMNGSGKYENVPLALKDV